LTLFEPASQAKAAPMKTSTLRRSTVVGIVITGMQAISRDGKVMTVTTNGIDATGQTVHDVAVYEKQ
jgi:hypothetical protein